MIENSGSFNLRVACPADALELAKLRFAFRSTTAASIEAGNEFVSRCSAWMAERLQSNLWRCWLVEHHETLIGTLWLQVIEKIPNPSAEPEYHAYITNFFVIESERGKGVGSRLLSSALSWCSDADVHAVVLWPTEETRSLYERFGFAVRSDLLELLVADIQHP
jgi:GNAT superfamily N-acetyltransferase